VSLSHNSHFLYTDAKDILTKMSFIRFAWNLLLTAKKFFKDLGGNKIQQNTAKNTE
jgi:hypothetical protein